MANNGPIATVYGVDLPSRDTGALIGGDPTVSASLDARFAPILDNTATYVWNTDGTLASATEAGYTTTYTYNANGTVATVARNGVTRTFTYNPDLTIASVA